MRDSLSAEYELLLTAARGRVDEITRVEIQRRVAAGVDWPSLTRTAQAHGVASLVFHGLVGTNALSRGDVRLEGLCRTALANAANSVVLSGELRDVLQQFERAGIPAIPYKGPVLSQVLYGDATRREFSDLDVIVKPVDVGRAIEVLRQIGYTPEFPASATEQQALVGSTTEYFRRFDRAHRAGQLVLELHWRIPATFPIGDDFWSRAIPVRFQGVDTRHFAPEDLLLVLCVHGFKHGWSQLKWICDVGELLESDRGVDWKAALERAAELGGLRVVLVGCGVVRDLLRGTLSPELSEAIERDRVSGAAIERFRTRCVRRDSRVGVWDNLRIRERGADRVRYGTHLLRQVLRPSGAERASWPQWPGASLAYAVSHPMRQLVRKLSR
jgi:hypothetical protein